MAYDGLFINAHLKKMKQELIGSKIEKIYQPQPYEILFSFRGKSKHLLHLSIASQNPRFFLTDQKPQMPEKAPIFCMFLRKHLGGAILKDIRQLGLERIVFFDFIAKNELGDDVERSICIEIMGKHSNLMLIENGVIKDALKRVNHSISVREIYGGVSYELPPTLKKNPEELTDFEAFKRIFQNSQNPNLSLSKCINSHLQGFSNSSAYALLLNAGLKPFEPCQSLKESEIRQLFDEMYKMMRDLLESNSLYLYLDELKKVREVSAVSLPQHEDRYACESSEDYDRAIVRFFNDSNDINIYSAKKSDLEKKLNLIIQKLEKRILNMNADLEKYSDFETFKLYGELLFANLYLVAQNSEEVEVLNYYTGEKISIGLDKRLSPTENANLYFKKYAKAKATLAHTKENIIATKEELEYLQSVKHYLSHIESYEDIEGLIGELQSERYWNVKHPKQAKKQKANLNKFAPLKYLSSDLNEIWVGKNNLQNDILTLKKSNKEFIWLHVKDMPGSHVVIQNTFENVSEECIYEAARIAAYHSNASGSSNVPVDFTEIKYVHKPSGAKAGMVIFTDNKTVYVTPDAQEIDQMRIR